MQDGREIVLRVASVRRATPATRIVRLDLGREEFPFEAGQAALIGPAGQPERVPYSVACAPEDARRDRQLEFLIRLEPSGRWGHKFDRLARGMNLAVNGPFGSFVFPAKPTERRFLFIAGGTGIAPIRAMLRHAVFRGYVGALRLLYSARTPSEFAYLSELRGMQKRGEIDLVLTATRDIPPRWRGERGRIAATRLAALVDDPATLCFVCGPASMVADVPPMLEKLGIPPSRIRLEDW